MGFRIWNFRPKLAQNCLFGGKIGKSGKIEKFSKKVNKGNVNRFLTFRMNTLAKFHQEKMIFDKIRGHLLILPFYRAPTRASERRVLFGKRL